MAERQACGAFSPKTTPKRAALRINSVCSVKDKVVFSPFKRIIKD